MKILVFFIASVLLAAYAQQQFAEVTTYYSNDSQCRAANVIGTLAVWMRIRWLKVT